MARNCLRYSSAKSAIKSGSPYRSTLVASWTLHSETGSNTFSVSRNTAGYWMDMRSLPEGWCEMRACLCSTTSSLEGGRSETDGWPLPKLNRVGLQCRTSPQIVQAYSTSLWKKDDSQGTPRRKALSDSTLTSWSPHLKHFRRTAIVHHTSWARQSLQRRNRSSLLN